MSAPEMHEAQKHNDKERDHAHAHECTVEKLGSFQAQLAHAGDFSSPANREPKTRSKWSIKALVALQTHKENSHCAACHAPESSPTLVAHGFPSLCLAT
jgi:hypothetical protein